MIITYHSTGYQSGQIDRFVTSKFFTGIKFEP